MFTDHEYCWHPGVCNDNIPQTADKGVQCNMDATADHSYMRYKQQRRTKCTKTSNVSTQCSNVSSELTSLQGELNQSQNNCYILELQIQVLRERISEVEDALCHMWTKNINETDLEIEHDTDQIDDIVGEHIHVPLTSVSTGNFSVAHILSMKNSHELFRFYTGLKYDSFMLLYKFIHADGFTVKYKPARSDILKLLPVDCLFLTFCRLRHAFVLQDLATRFCISKRSAGDIFNTWVDVLYNKLGQIPTWPHRNVIIGNMPRKYRADFPNSLAIIDATEIRTEIPHDFRLQSQFYSDYKSSTTLKALIVCDPSGSLLYVSKLCPGGTSDNQMVRQCGFLDILARMKRNGNIIDGDSIMADKGFTVHEDLNELGLNLNIPPFTSSNDQMSLVEIDKTRKIATHRIHVERLIGRIKRHKLIDNKIPTVLFGNIKQIFTVCCLITLFDDVMVIDKKLKF